MVALLLLIALVGCQTAKQKSTRVAEQIAAGGQPLAPPEGQPFQEQLLGLFGEYLSPMYGGAVVVFRNRPKVQPFDEAGVLNIYFDDLPGLNPRVTGDAVFVEAPPHAVGRAVLELCTTDVRPSPQGSCNGDFRLDGAYTRAANENDTFTYVGFSDQHLLVDYADDTSEIKLTVAQGGGPSLLAVPTTGRREVLLRGRWLLSNGVLNQEERYHSDFTGIRWDAFRIEGVDRVLVGGEPVEEWSLVDGNGVRFKAPVHAAGQVDVAVCAGDECVVRAGGLEYVEPILSGEGAATESTTTGVSAADSHADPTRGLLTPPEVKEAVAEFVSTEEGWSASQTPLPSGEGQYLRRASQGVEGGSFEQILGQSCNGAECNYDLTIYRLEVVNSSEPKQAPEFLETLGQSCLVWGTSSVEFRGARVTVTGRQDFRQGDAFVTDPAPLNCENISNEGVQMEVQRLSDKMVSLLPR